MLELGLLFIGIFAFAYFSGLAIGGALGLTFVTIRAVKHTVPGIWYIWRRNYGFNQLELVEGAMSEALGKPKTPLFETDGEGEVGPSGGVAGVGLGCLTILLFIPFQLVVTPFGLGIRHRRLAALRREFRQLTPEKQAAFAPEYRRLLHV